MKNRDKLDVTVFATKTFSAQKHLKHLFQGQFIKNNKMVVVSFQWMPLKSYFEFQNNVGENYSYFVISDQKNCEC